MFFLVILGTMLGLDLLWWIVAARLARRTKWRWLVHLFMAAQVIAFVWLIAARFIERNWGHASPKPVVAGMFIWHFLGLPLALLFIILLTVWAIVRGIGRLISRPASQEPGSPAENGGISRRQFLGASAALIPPLYTVSLTGIAMAQLNEFRTRRFELGIPNLPPDLDGMTIVQVSDTHIGRFTTEKVMRKVVEEVNKLRGDLVLLTGDLINDALADLPSGLDYVRGMDSGFGSYIIEGNHDLIEAAHLFEERVKASGIPFLLDETQIVQVRGTPVQLLGLSWTRGYAQHEQRDEAIGAAVQKLISKRQPDAFSIFMAHHPHAFDVAAENGIPLTLSGHTHGGQLMLNEQVGFGPVLFRYWSGLYRRATSQMIVSNGVGNWFPVRVNAPAELVHVTLRKAA